MRIAVTGANGFLGSRLCHSLSQIGHHTVALVRSQASTSLLPQNQAISIVDYNDPASIKYAIQDCDVLIHNAGKTRTATFEQMLGANLGITSKLLKILPQSPACHFIYISSQAASSPSVWGEAIDEDLPSAPVNWYGKSKAWAEKTIQKNCPVPWTILRPVPVYGPGDRDFLALFRMAKMGFSLGMGDDSQILNMIHVDELCLFVQKCIETPAAQNQVFFASDAQEYRQSRIVSAIQNAMGKKALRLNVPISLASLVFCGGELLTKISGKPNIVNLQKYQELRAPHWNCSVAKANRLLGWKPQDNFEQKIRETLQWYQTHGWL